MILARVLLSDETEIELTTEHAIHYRNIYTDIDIEPQFKRMQNWCYRVKAKRRPSRNGFNQFIHNWMKREMKNMNNLDKLNGIFEGMGKGLC